MGEMGSNALSPRMDRAKVHALVAREHSSLTRLLGQCKPVVHLVNASSSWKTHSAHSTPGPDAACKPTCVEQILFLCKGALASAESALY